MGFDNVINNFVDQVQQHLDYYYIIGLGYAFFCTFQAFYALAQIIWRHFNWRTVDIEVVALTEKTKINIMGQEIFSTYPVYNIVEGVFTGKTVTSSYRSSDISASFYQYVGDIMPGLYCASTGILESQKVLWIRFRRTFFTNLFLAAAMITGLNYMLKDMVNEDLANLLSLDFPLNLSWATLLPVIQVWAIFALLTTIRQGKFTKLAKKIASR